MFAIAALLFAISGDAALYQSNHHLYSLARTDGGALLLLDYDSGRLSRLRPAGDAYVGGPSIGVDTPVAVRVIANDDAVTIERDNIATVAHRVHAFTTEDLANGTLYLPATPGKHTAIVAVPGAGNVTRRSMALSAPYFARRGIAVLALDKRSDWQGATFENIADDVVAAVQMLRRRNDIGRIGLYASSQGGWVAPIAATRSADISFVVCAACPATPMPQQELIRTEYELRADGFSADQIGQALAYRRQLFGYIHDGSGLPLLEQLDTAAKSSRWYARFGGVPSREAPVAQWWRINDRSDPADAWRRVRVPALLLFAERDTRVPPAEHARLMTAANRRAKIVIVPKIDHEGFVARTGGGDEVPRLDRLPPRAVEPTIDWIVALP